MRSHTITFVHKPKGPGQPCQITLDAQPESPALDKSQVMMTHGKAIREMRRTKGLRTAQLTSQQCQLQPPVGLPLDKDDAPPDLLSDSDSKEDATDDSGFDNLERPLAY